MADSRIRYAHNGSVTLAYRIFGDGNTTIVYEPAWSGNVGWYDEPGNPLASLMQALSRDARVLVMDRRGNGLSDPLSRTLTPDDRVADLLAVLDAAELDRPPYFTGGDVGPAAIQFAATHPDRVQSLVLYGTAARLTQKLPDFPWGFTAEQVADLFQRLETEWGDGLLAEEMFGEAAAIPGVREMLGRLQRATASPGTIRLWASELIDLDVRELLGAVRVPTLVLSRPGDRMVSFEAAAALAAAIPGAHFHTLPPGPHSTLDIVDILMNEVHNFVLGKQSETPNERVLKTVLFTDIVGSTDQLSVHGDAHWRHQLDIHDGVIDDLLHEYGGVRANHTGDGIFALFEGPTNTVRCALAIVGALGIRGIRIRAGVHVGECERRGDEWSGMAVHVGARIAALADAGQVLTSRTVRDLCAGSGLVFEDLGPHHLKGVPEDASIYLAKNSR